MVSLVARAPKLIKTWEDKLDKLLDINICRCDIALCTDPSSGQLESCKAPGGAHIKCPRLLPFKLTPLELVWIMKQRNKV